MDRPPHARAGEDQPARVEETRYADDACWSGLCADIFKCALLDALGPQKIDPVGTGVRYRHLSYPEQELREVAYLARTNGDLVYQDLYIFFHSPYAKILADGAGLDVDPCEIWDAIKYDTKFRSELKRRLARRGALNG